MVDNPDYEGPKGAALRKQADELGRERSRLFDEATALRSAGNHKEANVRVEQAKKAGEEMKERHRQAAEAILRRNNEERGFGDDYLDLHGLREEEAISFLTERVEKLTASQPQGTSTRLTIIPGAGHHSGPAGQKLKAATERYLQAQNIAFTQINEGQLEASVIGHGKAAPSAPYSAADSKPASGKEAAAAEKTNASCCCIM